MSAVQSISWNNLVDIVTEARDRIYIVMPSLHHEWVDMLKMCNSETEIFICIENSEEVTRKGYGDTRLIKQCLQGNITVHESEELKIQFLYVDNCGWALFTESHILSGELKGYNAIELPKETSQQIIRAFFPSQNKSPDSVCSKPIDVIKLAEVEDSLNANPPIEPDIQRLVNVYSNYFQFVEIEQKQFTFIQKKINLPEDELQYWGDTISKDVQSQLTLFSKNTRKRINYINDIQKELNRCKQNYLTKFTPRKNKYILCLAQKIEFKNEIDKITGQILNLKKALEKDLGKAIEEKKEEIEKQLTISLERNTFIINEAKKELFPNLYITQKINKIKDKIHYPIPAELISAMNLSVNFYDLTYEDINHPEFKKWFSENDMYGKCNCNTIANTETTFGQKR